MWETFLNIADITVRISSQNPPQEEWEGHKGETDQPVDYFDKVARARERFNAKELRLSLKPLKRFFSTSKQGKVDIDIDLVTSPRYRRFKKKVLFSAEKDIAPLGGILHNKTNPSQGQQTSGEVEKYLSPGLDWRIAKSGKNFLLEGGVANRYQLLINDKLNKGKVFIISSEQNWQMTGIVHGFLLILIIHYLAKYKLGVLVHASGVKDGKNGYLFTGLSGAGKSTTSKIWDSVPSVSVLNDDRIIIKKEKNTFFMYPTPWHGDYADCLKRSVKRAPLTKMFYIYHKKNNKAQKILLAQTFDFFFKTLFIPFWDHEAMRFTSDFLSEIFSRTPAYEFGFKNDEKIIDYVRKIK